MIKFFLKFLISSITNNFKMIFLSQFKPKNLHSFYFSQCDEHVIAYQQCMGHVNWRNTLNANIITSRENGKCIYIYLTEKLQNRTVHISTSKQGNPLFPRLNTIPRSWTWLTWHTWRERRCHSCETLLRTRIHVWVISISWTRGLIATNGDAISIGGERRQKPRSEQSTMMYV